MLPAAHSDASSVQHQSAREHAGCTVWVSVVRMQKNLIYRAPTLAADGKAKFVRPFDHGRVWPIAEPVGLRTGAINLRIVPCPLQMPDITLRSIEPLIVIVLGCMRRKGAQADEVRR